MCWLEIVYEQDVFEEQEWCDALLRQVFGVKLNRKQIGNERSIRLKKFCLEFMTSWCKIVNNH